MGGRCLSSYQRASYEYFCHLPAIEAAFESYSTVGEYRKDIFDALQIAQQFAMDAHYRNVLAYEPLKLLLDIAMNKRYPSYNVYNAIKIRTSMLHRSLVMDVQNIHRDVAEILRLYQDHHEIVVPSIGEVRVLLFKADYWLTHMSLRQQLPAGMTVDGLEEVREDIRWAVVRSYVELRDVYNSIYMMESATEFVRAEVSVKRLRRTVITLCWCAARVFSMFNRRLWALECIRLYWAVSELDWGHDMASAALYVDLLMDIRDWDAACLLLRHVKTSAQCMERGGRLLWDAPWRVREFTLAHFEILDTSSYQLRRGKHERLLQLLLDELSDDVWYDVQVGVRAAKSLCGFGSPQAPVQRVSESDEASRPSAVGSCAAQDYSVLWHVQDHASFARYIRTIRHRLIFQCTALVRVMATVGYLDLAYELACDVLRPLLLCEEQVHMIVPATANRVVFSDRKRFEAKLMCSRFPTLCCQCGVEPNDVVDVYNKPQQNRINEFVNGSYFPKDLRQLSFEVELEGEEKGLGRSRSDMSRALLRKRWKTRFLGHDADGMHSAGYGSREGAGETEATLHDAGSAGQEEDYEMGRAMADIDGTCIPIAEPSLENPLAPRLRLSFGAVTNVMVWIVLAHLYDHCGDAVSSLCATFNTLVYHPWHEESRLRVASRSRDVLNVLRAYHWESEPDTARRRTFGALHQLLWKVEPRLAGPSTGPAVEDNSFHRMYDQRFHLVDVLTRCAAWLAAFKFALILEKGRLYRLYTLLCLAPPGSLAMDVSESRSCDKVGYQDQFGYTTLTPLTPRLWKRLSQASYVDIVTGRGRSIATSSGLVPRIYRESAFWASFFGPCVRYPPLWARGAPSSLISNASLPMDSFSSSTFGNVYHGTGGETCCGLVGMLLETLPLLALFEADVYSRPPSFHGLLHSVAVWKGGSEKHVDVPRHGGSHDEMMNGIFSMKALRADVASRFCAFGIGRLCHSFQMKVKRNAFKRTRFPIPCDDVPTVDIVPDNHSVAWRQYCSDVSNVPNAGGACGSGEADERDRLRLLSAYALTRYWFELNEYESTRAFPLASFSALTPMYVLPVHSYQRYHGTNFGAASCGNRDVAQVVSDILRGIGVGLQWQWMFGAPRVVDASDLEFAIDAKWNMLRCIEVASRRGIGSFPIVQSVRGLWNSVTGSTGAGGAGVVPKSKAVVSVASLSSGKGRRLGIPLPIVSEASWRAECKSYRLRRMGRLKMFGWTSFPRPPLPLDVIDYVHSFGDGDMVPRDNRTLPCFKGMQGLIDQKSTEKIVYPLDGTPELSRVRKAVASLLYKKGAPLTPLGCDRLVVMWFMFGSDIGTVPASVQPDLKRLQVALTSLRIGWMEGYLKAYCHVLRRSEPLAPLPGVQMTGSRLDAMQLEAKVRSSGQRTAVPVAARRVHVEMDNEHDEVYTSFPCFLTSHVLMSPFMALYVQSADLFVDDSTLCMLASGRLARDRHDVGRTAHVPEEEHTSSLSNPCALEMQAADILQPCTTVAPPNLKHAGDGRVVYCRRAGFVPLVHTDAAVIPVAARVALVNLCSSAANASYGKTVAV